ncbi:MAG: fumarate hydratase, partial [Desulfohalobiaceae bacterium]
MREVQADTIYQEMLQAIQQTATHLPRDVLQALQEAKQSEDQESAREVLDQLLKNAELARESGLPLCQDTGLGVFFVRLGQECRIEGGDLGQVLNQAMVDAYEQAYLRKSVCHPLSRANTGDNSPALIHFDLVPGKELSIRFMAKGGGSENMSRCTMLTPAQGWTGIKDFVLQRVAQAGPNPCPPTIVGVGIGGSFDQAPVLAKEALFQPLDQPNSDPELAQMEQELLAEINQLGVGPMGLGGKTTSLGVRIKMAPCHIASLPLAVNIQCHSSRHAEVLF